MADTTIKWAASHYAAYNSLYGLFKDYYDGKHRPVFSNERLSNAFSRLVYQLRDNLCPTVIDTLSDRLQLTGFQASDNTTANEFLTELWKQNRMDSKVGRIHAQALTTGDSYIIVWPNEQGAPTIFPQKMGQLAVKYADDSGSGIEQITEAVKAWNTSDGRLRVTRYLPNEIQRYVSRGKATRMPESLGMLVPYDEDGEASIVENPYSRVPVFRFANDPDDFAGSELRDVLPLQNLLNKELVDMAVASEHQALPQRWLVGAEMPVDPETGAPRKLEGGPGTILNIGSPDAKLGQFDPADMAKFLQVLDNLRLEIARVSRTPSHLFMLNTGTFPSGEALKTAEAPLLSKVKDRQNLFGEVWEDVAMFACEIAGIDPGSIEAVWEDTAPHSDKEQSEVMLNKQALGVSKRQILTEMGYSPAVIDKMAEENDQDTSSLADVAMKAFDSGKV